MTEQQVQSEGGSFNLSLSDTLFRKLSQKATEEGVTMEELARELLAEGLVLRAFEIAERKQAMKGQHSGLPGGQGGGGQRQPPRHQGRNAAAGNPQGRRPGTNNRRSNNYRQILEDSATFLEYVRSQEKRQR
jgi:hypothetical protein